MNSSLNTSQIYIKNRYQRDRSVFTTLRFLTETDLIRPAGSFAKKTYLCGMQAKKQPDRIEIRGARAHNLKNIDLDIPLGKIAGITGRYL